MDFDMTAGAKPIDELKVIGRPMDRLDGPLKTAGLATYAYEQHGAIASQVYGYVTGATIAKGRIRSIGADAIRTMPGVVTAADAGELGVGAFYAARAFRQFVVAIRPLAQPTGLPKSC